MRGEQHARLRGSYCQEKKEKKYLLDVNILVENPLCIGIRQ